jgi:methionyl-tRNA formyltransferase
MRILLWIGNDSVHRALAVKFKNEIDVVGLVIEKKDKRVRRTFGLMFFKAIEILLFNSVRNSWIRLNNYYAKNYPDLPDVPILFVKNINSDETSVFSTTLSPDLILVSGTSLINDKTLKVFPSKSIWNLHTGVSPYIKGGPNCTNWCLATKQFHLIGNTIMWLDLGIDSGNIITTELTEFTEITDLFSLHRDVFEHAHDLYIRAVKLYIVGTVPNINQSLLSDGFTYYNREWGLFQIIRAINNFKKFKNTYDSPSEAQKKSNLKLIPLISKN